MSYLGVAIVGLWLVIVLLERPGRIFEKPNRNSPYYFYNRVMVHITLVCGVAIMLLNDWRCSH